VPRLDTDLTVHMQTIVSVNMKLARDNRLLV